MDRRSAKDLSEELLKELASRVTRAGSMNSRGKVGFLRCVDGIVIEVPLKGDGKPHYLSFSSVLLDHPQPWLAELKVILEGLPETGQKRLSTQRAVSETS